MTTPANDVSSNKTLADKVTEVEQKSPVWCTNGTVSRLIEDDETFSYEAVKQGRCVLDWYTTWCGPCKKFAPVFVVLAAKYPEMGFFKVDAERPHTEELAEDEEIEGFPFIVAYNEGERVEYDEDKPLTATAVDAWIRSTFGLEL